MEVLNTDEIRRELESGSHIIRLVDPSGIDRSTLIFDDDLFRIERVILHRQWDELANSGFIVLADKKTKEEIEIERWVYWEEGYQG